MANLTAIEVVEEIRTSSEVDFCLYVVVARWHNASGEPTMAKLAELIYESDAEALSALIRAPLSEVDGSLVESAD